LKKGEINMPSMNATVNGWRNRVEQRWYPGPNPGVWKPCSGNTGVNIVVSSPTDDSGNYTENMFTVIIKVTMPTDSDIDYISSITIGVDPYDQNSTVGNMYGSLRTVDDSTADQYSVSDYRTHVAGGSSEVSTSPIYGTYAHEPMYYTFYGNFTPGASYYLWLYTKSNSDIYTLSPSSSIYNCTVTYEVKTYRVSYDANGGTGAPSYKDYEYNDTCTISNNIPSKAPSSSSSNFVITGNANGGDTDKTVTAIETVTTSYIFKGWSTSSSGSITYTAGSTFNVTEDITLYAVWESETSTKYSNNTLADLPEPLRKSATASYNLKINPDNGESITSQTVSKSASYTFAGWASTATGNVLDMATAYTSKTTVYAIWEVDGTDNTVIMLPIPTKASSVTGSYSVILNTNGGNVTNSSLTSNIRTIYTFMGWSTTTNYSDIVASPYIVTANTTLTAIWESESRIDGVLLPSAVKDGFNFLGWSEEPESTDYVPNPYIPITDVELYANYKTGKGIKAFLWHDNNWYRLMVDGL
jgi:uncharacterized repeat protein (TIGR02543 family)